jgi:DNA-binding GntR family transcriptional regulator
MWEAYQVRAVLEEMAAQSAAPKFKANVRSLQAELNALGVAAKLQDLDSFAQHDATFHRLIISCGQHRAPACMGLPGL